MVHPAASGWRYQIMRPTAQSKRFEGIPYYMNQYIQWYSRLTQVESIGLISQDSNRFYRR